MPIHREILSKLLAGLPEPVPQLRELHISIHWLIVNCQRYAMATFLRAGDPLAPCFQTSYLGDQQGRPITEIADCFADSEDPLRLGLITACLNGSLPLPEEFFRGNAVAPFAEMIQHCPTCFIGRFPKAVAWRDQGYPVTIIEMEPEGLDVHWTYSKPVLEEAEIVFITGLTLTNGTFLEVVERTPRAKYRVLMGPTVPFSPVFFEYGIHLVGSTLVSDASAAIRYAEHGGTSVREAPPGALRSVNITDRPELKSEFERQFSQPSNGLTTAA
jgi:hypothetical protein